MQSQNHGLMNSSSSTTLSLQDGSGHVAERHAHNQLIAQNLLNNSRIQVTRTSSHETASAHESINEASIQDVASTNTSKLPGGAISRRFPTSNTWTSSDGELPSNNDEVNDRTAFIDEYNRLARKHGVRSMIVTDFESSVEDFNLYGKSGSWFARKILRRTSSSQSIRVKGEQRQMQPLKHKRSISDLSLRLKNKHDRLKDKDLQELVKLCGSSLLYLPAGYAMGSLAVPTCFRATAQFLIQHAPTVRGIFRIPGSHGTVALLYNHYCSLDDGGEIISGTVRCPTLPDHIPCDVYDVASAFKKFLSGLPGGILGSLRLFDAFISIQTQLHSDPEWTRTKHSKVRARLIALAIYTLKSQYRRNLICAVFGLLCMIGRTAELSKREDDRGRPLPTSDLMGYGPLSIVFGPLLIGDLLESYKMRLADPRGGLILLPLSPPKSRKERQKRQQSAEDFTIFNSYVDKIKVANGVTEMLITHWREVVRHMKSFKETRTLTSSKSLANFGNVRPILRPSTSETFTIRKPPYWDNLELNLKRADRSTSPTPTGRYPRHTFSQIDGSSLNEHTSNLKVLKQRSRKRAPSFQMLTGSLNVLSPTSEENLREESSETSQAETSQDRGLKVSSIKGQEFERGSASSKHSRRSRHEESPKTPSNAAKLRKPRPIHGKKESKLLSEKGYKQDTKDSLSRQGGETAIFNMGERASGNEAVNEIRTKQKLILPFIQSGIFSQGIKLFPSTSRSKAIEIPQGLVSRHLRRLAGSEPYEKAEPVASSRRIISKSLPSRIEILNGIPRSKDPLMSVSKEEDVASLASLAQVIRGEDAKTTSGTRNIIISSSTRTISPVAASPAGIIRTGLFNSKTWEEQKDDGLLRSTSMKSSLNVKFPSKVSSLLSSFNHSRDNSQESSVDFISKNLRQLNATPKRLSAPPSPLKRFGSPAQSVKALAAKFDTANTTHVFERPSPKKLVFHNTSPLREDNLIAQYTTNTPSTVRSVKSPPSVKTPVITRIPLADCRSPLSTRQTRVSVETSDQTAKNSTDRSSDSPHENMPLGLFHRQLSNPIKPITDSCSAKIPIPPFVTQENIARTFDGHESVDLFDQKPAKQRSISSLSSLLMGDRTITSDQLSGSTGNSPGRAPRRYRDVRSPHVRFAQHRSASSSQSVDTEESAVDPSRSISVPEIMTRTGSPLPQTYSRFHTQIRDLQRQLTAKSVEARTLRQQLDARTQLDIGTLSEQLREAKKELLVWKNRAEVAEKQVEVLSQKSLGRRFSLQARQNKALKDMSRQTMEDAEPSNKYRQSWHGVDGAGEFSMSDWNSEETTGTVVREEPKNTSAV